MLISFIHGLIQTNNIIIKQKITTFHFEDKTVNTPFLITNSYQ